MSDAPATENLRELAAVFDALVESRIPGSRSFDSLPLNFLKFCFENHRRSRAQLFQDLLILFLLGEKRDGFFVEFGATDGVTLSNTFLLEADYGWHGILAEPARCWHGALSQNRRARIDKRCVWSSSGQSMEFTETTWPEVSTLTSFVASDEQAKKRIASARYPVETVSLNDLLTDHGAPRKIDYLSIDTEGTEYEILRHFDFNAHEIGIVTVEHNFATPHRENICELLLARGYERILSSFSKWDDWYVRSPQSGGVGRNAPCPCGSGKRYKHCHGAIDK